MDYKSSTTDTIEFEGETIRFTMRRLNRKDAMHVLPKMPEPDEAGDVVMSQAASFALYDEVADVLPTYIEITGGPSLDGNLITTQQIVDDMYFMHVGMQLMNKLFDYSFPKKDDEKKSGGQPPATLEASALSMY